MDAAVQAALAAAGEIGHFAAVDVVAATVRDYLLDNSEAELQARVAEAQAAAVRSMVGIGALITPTASAGGLAAGLLHAALLERDDNPGAPEDRWKVRDDRETRLMMNWLLCASCVPTCLSVSH